jgi:hypothetical protein
MSLEGFGGVLVWARHCRPLPLDDSGRFNFALCHFLPGPNIVNLSTVFSSRIRGIAGGIAAFAGTVRATHADHNVAGQGFFGFRWRYMMEIARQDDSSGALSEQNGGGKPNVRGEFDE